MQSGLFSVWVLSGRVFMNKFLGYGEIYETRAVVWNVEAVNFVTRIGGKYYG